MNANSQSNTSTFRKTSSSASEKKSSLGIHWLQSPIPFLAIGNDKTFSMFMRNLCAYVWKTTFIAGLCAFSCMEVRAYTTVTISSSAPSGLESDFIESTTNQFISSLFVNPLFANTYELKLFDFNPTYSPTPSLQSLFDFAVGQATTTYIYGFRDGMSYQQNAQAACTIALDTLCAYPTDFMLTQTTTTTFDSKTCQDTIKTVVNQIYQLSLSTPPVIPPVGQ